MKRRRQQAAHAQLLDLVSSFTVRATSFAFLFAVATATMGVAESTRTEILRLQVKRKNSGALQW